MCGAIAINAIVHTSALGVTLSSLKTPGTSSLAQQITTPSGMDDDSTPVPENASTQICSRFDETPNVTLWSIWRSFEA